MKAMKSRVKTVFLLITVCSAIGLYLIFIDYAKAQEKDTRILITSDTVRHAADSLASLWIAPFIDSSKVAKNWPSLEKGLSQQAVRILLGRPTKIEYDFQSAFTYWWYGRDAVVFNSITRKVSFWDK